MPPGHTNNPNGRPLGSKNKIGRDFHEAYEEAKARGYKHPYLVMMEWAHDEFKPLEVRGAMIKECASYTCMKPKITIRSEVPVLTSIEQAESSSLPLLQKMISIPSNLRPWSGIGLIPSVQVRSLTVKSP